MASSLANIVLLRREKLHQHGREQTTRLCVAALTIICNMLPSLRIAEHLQGHLQFAAPPIFLSMQSSPCAAEHQGDYLQCTSPTLLCHAVVHHRKHLQFAIPWSMQLLRCVVECQRDHAQFTNMTIPQNRKKCKLLGSQRGKSLVNISTNLPWLWREKK